jgi:streptomycin 6-kinase
MPRRVLDRARDLAGELGASAPDLLVIHDLHDADVLVGAREPWQAVDPKVVVGDPEYGVAQLLWRLLEDIEAHGGLGRQFRVLVEAAELDPTHARSWALVRCVDYWLWGVGVGLTEDPARRARIVDNLSPAGFASSG